MSSSRISSGVSRTRATTNTKEDPTTVFAQQYAQRLVANARISVPNTKDSQRQVTAHGTTNTSPPPGRDPLGFDAIALYARPSENSAPISDDALHETQQRLIQLFSTANAHSDTTNIDYGAIRTRITSGLLHRRQEHELQFIQQIPSLVTNHISIEASRKLLAQLDSVLEDYRSQLLEVGKDLQFLRNQSDVMDVRLKNRVEMHALLASCIISTVIDPNVIKLLLKGAQASEITDQYVNAVARFTRFYITNRRFYTSVFPKLLDGYSETDGSIFTAEQATAVRQSLQIVESLKTQITARCYPVLVKKIENLRVALGLSVVNEFGQIVDKQTRTSMDKDTLYDADVAEQASQGLISDYAALGSTNVAMQQQMLLKYGAINSFLALFTPDKAAQLRYMYVDTMSSYYRHAFGGYCATVTPFVDPTSYEMVIIGVEEEFDRLNVQQRREYGISRFILNPGRIFATLMEPERTWKQHINPYISSFDMNKYLLEIVVTDIIRLVLDNASSEYFFIRRFFANREFDDTQAIDFTATMFHATFDGCFSQIEDLISGLLSRSTDPVTIILCFYANIQNKFVLRSRDVGLEECCSGFITRLQMIFKKGLRKLLDSYASTIRHCNVTRLLQSQTRTPHYLIRQYADLTKTILTVISVAEQPSTKDGNNSIEIQPKWDEEYSLVGVVGEGLIQLLQEVDIILKMMAAEESADTAEAVERVANDTMDVPQIVPQLNRLSFVIQNLQYAIDVLATPLSVATSGQQHLEMPRGTINGISEGGIIQQESAAIGEVLQSYSDKFVNEAIRSRFGYLNTVVQQVVSQEAIGENGGGQGGNIAEYMQTREFMEMLESTTTRFNRSWRSDLSELNHIVVASFQTEHIGVAMLERSLSMLLQQYQRFSDVFVTCFNWQRQQARQQQQQEGVSGGNNGMKGVLRSQLVGVATVVAEMRKYHSNVA